MTDNDLTYKTCRINQFKKSSGINRTAIGNDLCKCKPANFPGFARVFGLTAMSVDRSVNIAAKVLGLHGSLH